MKTPWQDKTGLARATAILATVLTVSLGLCGANFAAVTQSGFASKWFSTLAFTGCVELLAIFGSLLGLVIVLLIYIGRSAIKGKG